MSCCRRPKSRYLYLTNITCSGSLIRPKKTTTIFYFNDNTKYLVRMLFWIITIARILLGDFLVFGLFIIQRDICAVVLIVWSLWIFGIVLDTAPIPVSFSQFCNFVLISTNVDLIANQFVLAEICTNGEWNQKCHWLCNRSSTNLRQWTPKFNYIFVWICRCAVYFNVQLICFE